MILFAPSISSSSKFCDVPYINGALPCAFLNRIYACRLSICPAMLDKGKAEFPW